MNHHFFTMGLNLHFYKHLKSLIVCKQIYRLYHAIPVLDLFEKITGQEVSKDRLPELKKKHPNIDRVGEEDLKWSLRILEKFNINTLEACNNIHVLTMNPITIDNYAEILKECGFVKILPKHIIQYRTLVSSKSIKSLKKLGLINKDLHLEQLLLNCFPEWPDVCKISHNYPESTTSILTVRMNVLENYLAWKLYVTPDDFQKYCRNYLPIKHKPMSDIKEAIHIAQHNIQFSVEEIRRNGFIISSDPINTKLIIENVPLLAGLDIKEAVRIEPAILKNNYNALLKIRNLLEEYRIPAEAQRRCLKVYCMRPDTVEERLNELINLKEYQLLSTNPRVLSMVVHKKKMISRLTKIEKAKKQCYSLNHLVSSSKVFNNYISSFGNKVCGRDIATLICSSLDIKDIDKNGSHDQNLYIKDLVRTTIDQLRKHKYWLHSSLDVIDENINFLKKNFNDRAILNNCQLLLYPISEIQQHLNILLKMRNDKLAGSSDWKRTVDANYNIDYTALTDDHILSLVLYEIEKKYYFTGDGIWYRQEAVKLDSKASN